MQVEEKTQLNRIVASDKKDGATLRRLVSVLEGANLLARYDQAMQDVHALDFTDLITQVHYLLQDPEVYARWQHKYKYISVDEMQDTSDLEYVVLKNFLQITISCFAEIIFKLFMSGVVLILRPCLVIIGLSLSQKRLFL